jgi:hypothetical protein
MSNNIILESDSFTLEALSNWIHDTNYHKKLNLYLLTRPERKDKFLSLKSKYKEITCITYDDLCMYKSMNNLDLSLYEGFINFFFRNSLPGRFLDREGYLPHYGIGVQNAFAYYTDVAYNLLSFLIDKQIRLVYFRNTPHEFLEHFLSQASEFLNIELITSEQQVFTWMFTLRKGVNKEREWLFKDETFEDPEEVKHHISNYVKKLNGKYEDAIPLYEKERMGKGLFKYYNPFLNIRYILSRPQKLWCMTRNFFFYKTHSINVDFKNLRYFLFFLHYQPERSTLPEGYGFEDQFYAIKILSKMLPKGIKLIVKEHPSMFSRGSEFKVRSIYNYKSILKLPNVSLSKMNMDNFQLIDNALAVSTITGTVGLESYVRKKPVILFGRTVLNVPGVHAYKSISELRVFVDQVINQEIQIKAVIDNLVKLCANGTFSGLEDLDPVNSTHSNKAYKEKAHLKSLNVLFQRMLKV